MSADKITRVFPDATIFPSLSLIQDSRGAGFPVALQYKVTFFLSFSMTVMFCGLWIILAATTKVVKP